MWAVISAASLTVFVFDELSTKYSRTPENLPLLVGKKTYLPAPTGLALRLASNCVVTSIETVSGAKNCSALKTNWVKSENNNNCSENGTACLRIDTWLFETATSIGAESTNVITVFWKKLKYSPTSERITFSSDSIPSLFLWKNISFTLIPVKDGKGFVSSSPAFLSFQDACVNKKVPSACLISWWGIVVLSKLISKFGATLSFHTSWPLPSGSLSCT